MTDASPTPHPRFAGERVLVTGARGRLGRGVVAALTAAGAEVVGVSRTPPAPSPGGPRWVRADLREPAVLEKELAAADVVVHLAAVVRTATLELDPADEFEQNAAATARLLEALRRAGRPRFVYASTAQVYGRPRALPVPEDHPTVPLNTYAASKLAGEAMAAAYAATYGFPAVLARIANVYGPGVGPESALGLALHQAAAGGPIELRDLRPVRDFLYLPDAAHALVGLAAEVREAGPFVVNVSSGQGVSIGEAAQTVAEAAAAAGLGRVEVRSTGHGAEGVPALVLDNARLVRRLGWRPSTPLRAGVEATLRHLAPNPGRSPS